MHSHNSCRTSGDSGGSRDRTRNCCIAVWFTQCLSQLSHHIPDRATTSPTEPPHPPSSLLVQWVCQDVKNIRSAINYFRSVNDTVKMLYIFCVIDKGKKITSVSADIFECPAGWADLRFFTFLFH
jgi:hypothetical protein